MSWYLAPSLAVLRAEVDARWPRRDRTSDGTIGDAAHAKTRSDHNPNERGSVNAIDIDGNGVHMPTILAAVEKHPSAHYWIWQRVIADRDDGWRPQAYTGSNPHTAHAHVSIRQSVTAEQDRRPWGLLVTEEEFMAKLTDAEQQELLKRVRALDGRLAALINLSPTVTTSWSDRNPTGVDQVAAVDLLTAVRDRPQTVPELDYDRLAAALLRRLATGQGQT